MAEGMGGVAAGIASTAAAAATTTTNTGTGTEGAATTGAVQSATPAAATPGQPQMFDVKVDGKMVRMTEQELRENASLGKAAFKRMEEANGLRAQAEAFWESFQKDPMAALDNPALKLTAEQKRTALENYYKKNYIDQDRLTPEQKELQATKLENERYKKAEADRTAAEQQTKTQALEAQWREHYSKTIIDALDKGGLPKNPKTVGRMAFYMSENAKHNYNQTIEQIVARVDQDFSEEFQGVGRDASPETLIRILGPDAVKKIQQFALQQHKAKLSETFAKPQAAEPRRESGKPKEAKGSNWQDVSKYWTRRDR